MTPSGKIGIPREFYVRQIDRILICPTFLLADNIDQQYAVIRYSYNLLSR